MWSACGEVMDIIRAPYKISMVQYPGGPAVPGRWCISPPGAKFLDVPTPFHSRYHDGPDYQSPIGEVWPDDFHLKCGFPTFVKDDCPCPPDGQTRCGSDKVWSGEGDPAVDPLFETDQFGVPLCCRPPIHCAIGGEAEGGTAVAVPLGVAVGGEAEGGRAIAMSAVACYPYACRAFALGGEAEGGLAVGTSYPMGVAVGGEAEGGTAVGYGTPLADAVGGEGEGGTAVGSSVTPPCDPDFVNADSATQVPSTSITVNLASSTPGQVNVVCVANKSLLTWNTPAGWTLVNNGVGVTGWSFAMYARDYVFADPSTLTVTLTSGSALCAGSCVAFASDCSISSGGFADGSGNPAEIDLLTVVNLGSAAAVFLFNDSVPYEILSLTSGWTIGFDGVGTDADSVVYQNDLPNAAPGLLDLTLDSPGDWMLIPCYNQP